MAAGSITSFYTGWSLLPVASDPTDGIGYMLLTGILGLVLSLPLIIGLICIRKTCFAVTP
jgi:hypothetical protein